MSQKALPTDSNTRSVIAIVLTLLAFVLGVFMIVLRRRSV